MKAIFFSQNLIFQYVLRLHHSHHESIRGLDRLRPGGGARLVLGAFGPLHLHLLHHCHHLGGERERTQDLHCAEDQETPATELNVCELFLILKLKSLECKACKS